MAAAAAPSIPAHVPVLLAPLLAAVAPVNGRWIDGTFGAGGYTLGLLGAGADHVTAIDRDPTALKAAEPLLRRFDKRLSLVQSTFGALDRTDPGPVAGIVLDLGVSSMQIDRAERGFSFQKEGPLDMRMGGEGPTAADLVNTLSEAELADILFQYGEERASRRIARAIVAERAKAPIATTLRLAGIVSACLPPRKAGQSHPATRSFQALRIAVNDEMAELIAGLEAAERVLVPGGWLAVVSFHSMEDRVVKRFFQDRSATAGGSRHAPAVEMRAARFEPVVKGAGPDEAELDANPRARSARLRVGRRTDAPAALQKRDGLGLPGLVVSRDGDGR